MSKSRTMFCFLIVLVVCLAAPCFANQVINMIPNGSFEIRTAASGTPSGWRFYSNEGSTYTWGYSPCSGGRDMRIVKTSSGGETLLDNWDRMVPITPGMTYRYKFVAKGSGTLLVTAGWATLNNTYTQTNYTYNLTSSYQSYNITITAPAGYAKSFFAFRMVGTGNFCIDDVAMILDPGTQQFPDAYCNPSFTYFCNDKLMEVWGIGDGSTGWNVIWDKECRYTMNNSTGHYMYFGIDNSYMYANSSGYKTAVTVEYADNGYDTFTLEYDGTGGAYTSAGSVTKTGTLEWKKKTFYISNAYFGNRENGGADFRISDNGDGPEYISYVAVSHWDSTQGSHARIKDNHLEMDNTATFLKTAQLAADFCNENLVGMGYPTQFAAKGYTAAKVISYWFHFETANGTYGSTTNVNNYINDCYNRGMDLGMTFETGNVGGGAVPEWMFNSYPCQSYNSSGQPAIDTEYGTNFKVQSISSDAFLHKSRGWMTWMLRQVDKTKIRWYETAVEPQYIGNQWLDYSAPAYEKWRLWLAWRYTISYLNSQWGTSYTNYDQIPMPTSSSDPKWNTWMVWRAYELANWINGDTQTIRNLVGEEALVAVDALIVSNMGQRMGDQNRVMNAINPNIFQVNWHWFNRAAYDTGYNLCVPIARTKNQAISEHMTLNNSDYVSADVDAILRHTLTKGNKFGWEFVNMRPTTSDSFALYYDNWAPKPLINVVDSNNAYYMNLGASYLLQPL
ncbi:MAG: carbohydrate binding domain-containing protein [Armatimonadota bacterium]